MESNASESELPYHAFKSSIEQVDYSNPLLMDKICGVLLILCFLFGTILNSFALAYFSKTKTKTLAEKLYTMISGVDLCTSIAQTPVILTLLNLRLPFAFSSRVFCGVWIFVFEYLQRVSIYLIVLLSVTRTIAIVLPFTIIREAAVLFTLIPYSVILLSDIVIGLIFFEQAFYYGQDYTYPIKGYNQNKSLAPTQDQLNYMDVQNWAHNMEVVLPSIVIFVSFVVAIVKMRNVPRYTSSDKTILRASITVTLATALFLICNLPFFLSLSMVMYDDYQWKHQKNTSGVFENAHIGPHIWPVTKVIFPALNAALNPVLYYFRIKRFRTWVHRLTRLAAVNEHGESSGFNPSRPDLLYDLRPARFPLSPRLRRTGGSDDLLQERSECYVPRTLPLSPYNTRRVVTPLSGPSVIISPSTLLEVPCGVQVDPEQLTEC